MKTTTPIGLTTSHGPCKVDFQKRKSLNSPGSNTNERPCRGLKTLTSMGVEFVLGLMSRTSLGCHCCPGGPCSEFLVCLLLAFTLGTGQLQKTSFSHTCENAPPCNFMEWDPGVQKE